MEKQELKAYLKQVYALELDIYTMEEAMQNLVKCIKPRREKKHFDAPTLKSPTEKYAEADKSEIKKRVWTRVAIVSVCLLLCGGIGPGSVITSLLCAAGMLLPVVTPIIIMPIALKNVRFEAVEREKRELEAEHKKAMAKYQEDIEQEEDRYRIETEEVERYNLVISHQIQSIDRSQREAMDALNKLYGLNVIYPKYRSLVPVTMFCEYLESGRRGELEGTNGMYDLYETELRAGIIIGELKEIKGVLHSINAKLSAIQRNQYMLYKAVEQGNALASSISTAVGELADNTAKIRSSTAQIKEAAEWTAMNTEMIARRTETIASIQEYEHTHKYPLFHA